MENPRIVGALMLPERGFFLEYNDRTRGITSEQGARGREPDEAAADHRNWIVLLHGIENLPRAGVPSVIETMEVVRSSDLPRPNGCPETARSSRNSREHLTE